MKKDAKYFFSSVIFGIALACIIQLGFYYYRTHPFLSPTYYSGKYVDLSAQADYEAWLQSKPPSEQSYILKVDKKTNLPACTEIAGNGKTIVSTSFFHDGVEHDLRFQNNVLVGARRSYSAEKEALAAELFASSWDALPSEQQEAIDLAVLEIILDNQSWQTDTETLKPILDDYAAQVRALSDTMHTVS